jgi:glycolate dehydrogenase FAD-binding subunit
VTGPVLAALVDICGPSFARVARSVDAVGGRRAGHVAIPPTPAAVADVLRLGADRGLSVVARGSGSKLDWGAPRPPVDLILDTGRLNGMWDHDPAAGTAEVAAGTPVHALQAALALHGQALPVDPPSRTATVGGVLAVNESGPLRYRFGGPAGHVVRVVSVDRAGVVAEGALPGPAAVDGVLTSAVIRLRSLPAARRWVTVPLPNPAELGRLVAPAAGHEPSAIEVDLPAGVGMLAALIEGDEAEVSGRAGALALTWGERAAVTETAPRWWGRYPFGPSDVAVRLSVSPPDLPATVYALADALGGPVPVRGSAGLGSVHAVLPGSISAERLEQTVEILRHVLMARNGQAVPVAAPPELAGRLEMAGRRELF